jgi:hypothetical protein
MKRFVLICLMGAGAAAVAGAQQPAATQQGNDQQPEVPAEYKPPKGMCRVWLKDVPPSRQAAPTDCNTAVKNCPSTGRVIWGDTQETKNKPKPDPKDVPATKALTGKGSAVPIAIPKKPPV